MRVTTRFTVDPQRLMREEARIAEMAVTRAMGQAARMGKKAWRGEVVRAGLGRRLSYTIQSRAFPQGAESIDAAAVVWSKAPKIVGAHAEGALIRSADGFWLAIPLPGAGKGRFGRKMTPREYELKTGRALDLVYRPGRSGLLVDTGRMANERRNMPLSQPARAARQRRRGFRSRRVVPVFALVPQVKLPKRLDLDREADRVGSAIPRLIVGAWDQLDRG